MPLTKKESDRLMLSIQHLGLEALKQTIDSLTEPSWIPAIGDEVQNQKSGLHGFITKTYQFAVDVTDGINTINWWKKDLTLIKPGIERVLKPGDVVQWDHLETQVIEINNDSYHFSNGRTLNTGNRKWVTFLRPGRLPEPKQKETGWFGGWAYCTECCKVAFEVVDYKKGNTGGMVLVDKGGWRHCEEFCTPIPAPLYKIGQWVKSNDTGERFEITKREWVNNRRDMNTWGYSNVGVGLSRFERYLTPCDPPAKFKVGDRVMVNDRPSIFLGLCGNKGYAHVWSVADTMAHITPVSSVRYPTAAELENWEA